MSEGMQKRNVLKDDLFKKNETIFILVNQIHKQSNLKHNKLINFENLNQVDLKKLDLEFE